jgi:hypothetical protein
MNSKPDSMYYEYIFDFLMNYDKIKGFRFLSNKKNDFLPTDLSIDKLNLLKLKRPELFHLQLI